MKDVLIETLKKVPLFKSLGRSELRHLSASGTELEFGAGSTIVYEGKIGSDFYLIESGRARVTQGGKVLRELGPGDFFGELGILYGARRSASVEAKTRVWVFRLDREEFFDFLDNHGVIARKVLMEFARRTRSTTAGDLT